ncbi:MAG: hypothetical protein JSS62_05625 [Verrucomicrobia bacterium]|nr:hypothetical protein [Verrucomicrobiota bacterium]MBS0647172.1 hypothetical protein [Verrucomicrobiota bacterium]
MDTNAVHPHRHHNHHEAGPAVFCIRAVAITIVAASIISMIAGVFAYLVAAGHLTSSITILNILGSIGVSYSYVLAGGSLAVFVISSLALILHSRSSCTD